MTAWVGHVKQVVTHRVAKARGRERTGGTVSVRSHPVVNLAQVAVHAVLVRAHPACHVDGLAQASGGVVLEARRPGSDVRDGCQLAAGIAYVRAVRVVGVLQVVAVSVLDAPYLASAIEVHRLGMHRLPAGVRHELVNLLGISCARKVLGELEVVVEGHEVLLDVVLDGVTGVYAVSSARGVLEDHRAVACLVQPQVLAERPALSVHRACLVVVSRLPVCVLGVVGMGEVHAEAPGSDAAT